MAAGDTRETTPVATVKLRLRRALRAAMAERQAPEVEILRSLLGAIDQAEAVPVAPGGGYTAVRFGDPAAEVPRKRLSVEDVRAVIERERDELRHAAETYASIAQADIAARCLLKAAILDRYAQEIE